MTPKDFKSTIKSTSHFLKGKTITVLLMTKTGAKEYTFSTLKGFGKAILAFEAMGATFGFLNVKNPLCSKSTKNAEEYLSRLSTGVWTDFHFLATTLKHS